MAIHSVLTNVQAFTYTDKTSIWWNTIQETTVSMCIYILHKDGYMVSYLWNSVFRALAYPHSEQYLQLSSELHLLLHLLGQLQKLCIASSCVAPLKQFKKRDKKKKPMVLPWGQIPMVEGSIELLPALQEGCFPLCALVSHLPSGFSV